MNLVALLVILIIACVVLWAARALIAAFSIQQPFATLIYVVIVLIVLFWVLGNLGIATPDLD